MHKIVLSIILASLLLEHGHGIPQEHTNVNKNDLVQPHSKLDPLALLTLASHPALARRVTTADSARANRLHLLNAIHWGQVAKHLHDEETPLDLPSVRSRSNLTMQAAEAVSPLNVLFDFTGSSGADAVDAWERIDDVIMGGVSSSRFSLSTDGSGAVFEGRIRSDGGGFCGQRMRLLAEPLDLSRTNGIFIDCAVLPDVGPDPSKRVWKITIRTKQDRGEVVYQAQFEPPRTRDVVRVPFDKFRLVRGPRLVPGVPPLSSFETNATYQISVVVTKFMVSENVSALPDFQEGLFALKIFRVGAYNNAIADSGASLQDIPRPLTPAEVSASAPIFVRLLRPLFSSLFSEKARRRRAATNLLQTRGSSRMQRIRLGWAWRKAGPGGLLGAIRRTLALILRDGMAAVLSLPLRILFRIIRFFFRIAKRIKGLVKTDTRLQQPL